MTVPICHACGGEMYKARHVTGSVLVTFFGFICFLLGLAAAFVGAYLLTVGLFIVAILTGLTRRTRKYWRCVKCGSVIERI